MNDHFTISGILNEIICDRLISTIKLESTQNTVRLNNIKSTENLLFIVTKMISSVTGLAFEATEMTK